MAAPTNSRNAAAAEQNVDTFATFFDLIRGEPQKDGKKINKEYKCILCLPKKHTVKCDSTSTSNLRRHIKIVHSTALSKYDSCRKNLQTPKQVASQKRAAEDSIACSSGSAAAKRLTLESFGVGLTKNVEKTTSYCSQQSVDRLIINYIVCATQPLRTVENVSFIQLVKGLQPTRTVMTRKTLCSRIDKDNNSSLKNLKKTLLSVDYVCTTADCWTADRRAFLGVTAHWYNGNLQRESAALACRRVKGSHTFDIIAKELQHIYQEFSIQNKITHCVTDNGSNFIKAFVEFSKQLPGDGGCCDSESSENSDSEEDTEDNIESGITIVPLTDLLDENEHSGYQLPPHHRCAAHGLNLVLSADTTSALQDKDFKKNYRSSIAKCDALWRKSAHSTKLADMCEEKSIGRLQRPCSTRWNSRYDAIKDLLKKFENDVDSLNSLCDAAGLPRFSGTNIEFLKEYVKVVAPAAISLDILQGDKHVALGYLLPTIWVVKKKLATFQGSSEIHFCRPLIKAILEGINKRFARYFEKSEYILAAVAHPMFKLTWIDTVQKKAQAKDVLLREMKKMEASQQLNNNKGPEQPAAISCVETGDGEDFFSILQPSRTCTPSEDGIETEADRFLSESTIRDCIHCFASGRFPVVKQLFISHNTSIPSSAAVERLFSLGGVILSPRRRKLSDAMFEKLVLLKMNMKYL